MDTKKKSIRFAVLNNYSPSEAYLKNFLDICDNEDDYVVYSFNNVQESITSLERDKVDYIVFPSRLTFDNVMNNAIIDVINRMNVSTINEVFCFVDENYKYIEQKKENFRQPVFFGNKVYKRECVTKFDNNSQTNYLEYKIFKKNAARRNWFQALLLSLFTTRFGRAIYFISSITSVVLLAITVFLSIFKQWHEKTDLIKIFSESIPLFVIFCQILFKSFNAKEKAQRKLITGYWLYYSFEDQYISGSFVPKGFTTRLLEITNKQNNLTFTCRFSGNDTNFFSSSNNEFSFSMETNVGEGSYHYVTNIINNKGRRAEGVCMYRGIKGKRQEITNMDGWFSGRGTGVNGRVKYLRISKEDYEILKKAYPDRSSSFRGLALKIGIFGDEKSNTDVAFENAKEKDEILEQTTIQKVFYDDFYSMVNDLENRRIDGAIVPVSNKGIYINVPNKDEKIKDIFLRNQKVYKYKEFDYIVEYVLASLDPHYHLNENTTIVSNIETLKQCADFAASYKQKVYSSTSTSAKSVAINFDGDDYVAICNKEAALFYGLSILRDEFGTVINPYINDQENRSKFYMFFHKDVNL